MAGESVSISRLDFQSYRSAAKEMIGSLREAYPELTNDSLSMLCYCAAIELQSDGGHASAMMPDEFVETIAEQASSVAAAHQDDAFPNIVGFSSRLHPQLAH